MQAGSLLSSDVLALTSRIFVGGIEREFDEWSITRDLNGDLPEQVVAGSGIKQATGTIVWAEGEDLTGTAANPWNPGAGWLPVQGQTVVIYVSDGVTEWAQFAGVIDENAGDVGGRPSSTIVDYIDYLNRPVSHSTVLRLHPPKTEGGDYMGVGMSAGYAVDRAMRACGFYATPAIEPGAVLSVPGQMSTWPEYGTITAAGTLSGTGTHAANYRAAWGWCLANFSCTYTPAGTITPTDPIQLTARIALEHSGNFTLNAFYGSTRVQLAVAGSRTVIARLGSTDICSIALGPAATIVTLQVKNGVWTIRTGSGATATGSATVPAGSNLTTITTTGDDNTRAAGLQVSKPPAGSEFRAVTTTLTSYYQETSLFAGLMDVLPSYVNKPAIDLLTEISKANLAGMWFNELGQFRFIGSDVLRNQAPVQTITTADDIRALSWSDARLGMRSRVRVKYRLPILNRSRWSNVLLWQGAGESMGSGQEKALIAEAPSGEDWAEIDNGAVGNEGGLAAFNAGKGTWVGGYLEDGAGAWSSAAGYYTWDSIVSLDERTRLFKVTAGTLPAGKTLVLATPDDAANYFPRFRGFNFPVLRGRAKVTWADAQLTAAAVGPYGFPELEHDAGPWGVQADNTIIQTRLADFIAGQVTTPAPTITGMTVGYDPRRQLGDVVMIESPDLMGISIKALIVGIRNSGGESSFTQSLTVRIITAASTYTTYAQFDQAHPDALTYDQWQALFPSTATYDYFNAQPLRGA